MQTRQYFPSPFFGWKNLFENSCCDSNSSKTAVPQAACYEKEGVYTLEVELPGVKKDQVEVNVEQNVLSVKGTRSCCSECGDVTYSRSFRISSDIDSDSIEASMEDGVLKLTLTKKKSAEARKLSIQ